MKRWCLPNWPIVKKQWEMEGFIMTAKVQCLSADTYKAKKDESNLTCCLCHKFDETFGHIVSMCLLAKKEYVRLCQYIHFHLYSNYGTEVPVTWYKYVRIMAQIVIAWLDYGISYTEESWCIETRYCRKRFFFKKKNLSANRYALPTGLKCF